MILHTKRQFSPREQTHLARFAQSPLLATNSTAPVEYLTGKAEFCDFVLSVDTSVLIPRIETEELVTLVKKEMMHRLNTLKKNTAVLEIGTGSGAITIALARQLLSKWSQLRFVATDISQAALTLAQKNSKAVLGPNAPIKFVTSNLLANIGSQKFDYIIANLPYIPSSRIASLDESVKDHEPLLALDGGPTGFELIATVLTTCNLVCTPYTKIFLEIDHTHSAKNFAPYNKLGWHAKLYKDQAGLTRFAVLSQDV